MYYRQYTLFFLCSILKFLSPDGGFGEAKYIIFTTYNHKSIQGTETANFLPIIYRGRNLTVFCGFGIFYALPAAHNKFN